MSIVGRREFVRRDSRVVKAGIEVAEAEGAGIEGFERESFVCEGDAVLSEDGGLIGGGSESKDRRGRWVGLRNVGSIVSFSVDMEVVEEARESLFSCSCRRGCGLGVISGIDGGRNKACKDACSDRSLQN